jgi:hypothetical protein
VNLRLPALLLVSALMLGSCQFEAVIEIVQNGRTPDFVVRYDKGRRACVEGLTVTRLSDGRRQNVWAVRRGDAATDASCADRFTYPVVPAGYALVVRQVPLEPGDPYEVHATGVGWTATELFSVR